MSSFETWLLALTVIGLITGAWGIVWARTGGSRGGIYLGRGLFIATLLFLGASSLLAAWHRADGLAPLGLSAGFLVIFMLWEAPSNVPRLAPLSVVQAEDSSKVANPWQDHHGQRPYPLAGP